MISNTTPFNISGTMPTLQPQKDEFPVPSHTNQTLRKPLTKHYVHSHRTFEPIRFPLSRATPKINHYLNYNKPSITSNTQTNFDNVSSRPSTYTTNTVNTMHITPQPIINTNASNGILDKFKSILSPFLSNDNNTSEPQLQTSNTPTTPLNNEMELTDTVELLDNEALAECVLEIVESDKKNDNIPSTPKKNDKKNENNIHVNTYFEDLLQCNLTPNNNKNELLKHINKSVVKDDKRQLTPNNSPNPIQPTRTRRKTNDLPIGVVRSKTHTNVTHALQQGVNMIREHNSPTNTPQPQRKRSRKVFEEIEMNIKEEEEPPMKKIKVITPPTTPILSQETVDNEEVILTPDSPISKRHCRLNNIYEHEKNNKLPIVSVCCSIKILNENKQRYLKVYKQRLERIYSKYNMKNKIKINEFMDRYGGDCDKLHELYVKICNKYDLIALDKYDGQMKYIATNEVEISKQYKPPIVKGIDLSLIMKEKEIKPLETRSSESSVLTQENIHRYDANSKGMNKYNCDSHSQSDGTHSTFQTPRTFKDIETQSNKSETLNVCNNNETNKNGFFTQPIELQSKKTRSYDSISLNELKKIKDGYYGRFNRILTKLDPSRLPDIPDMIKRCGNDPMKFYGVYKHLCDDYLLQTHPPTVSDDEKMESPVHTDNKSKEKLAFKGIQNEIQNNGLKNKQNNQNDNIRINSVSNNPSKKPSPNYKLKPCDKINKSGNININNNNNSKLIKSINYNKNKNKNIQTQFNNSSHNNPFKYSVNIASKYPSNSSNNNLIHIYKSFGMNPFKSQRNIHNNNSFQMNPWTYFLGIPSFLFSTNMMYNKNNSNNNNNAINNTSQNWNNNGQNNNNLYNHNQWKNTFIFGNNMNINWNNNNKNNANSNTSQKCNNNIQNNTFNNNTANNQWNNVPNNTQKRNNNIFGGNSMGNNMGNNMKNNMGNNSFSFSDNKNNNLDNNNWNNNQFTFGNNNNNNSGPVSSINNAFFHRGIKKRPFVRACRRNK